jgi:hypothetical protein
MCGHGGGHSRVWEASQRTLRRSAAPKKAALPPVTCSSTADAGAGRRLPAGRHSSPSEPASGHARTQLTSYSHGLLRIHRCVMRNGTGNALVHAATTGASAATRTHGSRRSSAPVPSPTGASLGHATPTQQQLRPCASALGTSTASPGRRPASCSRCCGSSTACFVIWQRGEAQRTNTQLEIREPCRGLT